MPQESRSINICISAEKIKKFILWVVFATFSLSTAVNVSLAQEKTESVIHIDIPVKLENAKVVFVMDRLSFAGDMPYGLKYMSGFMNHFKVQNTKVQIVAIFYADATYLVLNDNAYNACRHITTGNPYKEPILQLIKNGAQVEVCAVAMKANNISNEDLIPGIKVNSGAIGRIVSLVQDGFIQIEP